MDSVQGSDLATFLGDLSQSEILSEIEPPLKVACFQKFDGAQKNMPNHYLLNLNVWNFLKLRK